MTTSSNDAIRTAVRERYAYLAATDGAGCGCQPGCCGTPAPTPDAMSRALGYSAADLLAVPEGANLGLGCGNPRAIAALRPGETVLDLGSGAGFDCFLAAAQVGVTGRVIGIDMTPDSRRSASSPRTRAAPSFATGRPARRSRITWCPRT